MATSERTLRPVPSAANVQRLTALRSWNAVYRPAWRQLLIDFTAILFCLTVVPLLFGEGVAIRAAPTFFSVPAPASCALTLIIVTVFAFAGAYPRRHTPLEIADTEGLVRGIACTGIILAIARMEIYTLSGLSALSAGSALIAVLAVRREFGHMRQPGWKSTSFPQASVARVVLRSDQFTDASEYAAFFELPDEENSASYLAKRILDILLAVAVLIVATPLLLTVAVLIKIDSRGPVLIRQRRIGWNGKPFFMWKFRSMYDGVERYAHSPVTDSDPRLTRFGRSLRRFSIDELPQLFNVLTGEMSLVGPRPEMPFIVKKYSAEERLRLNAVPGITGLWQISPARAMPIHENIELDLFYIAHRNIFLDLAILLRTVTAVIRGIGAT